MTIQEEKNKPYIWLRSGRVPFINPNPEGDMHSVVGKTGKSTAEGEKLSDFTWTLGGGEKKAPKSFTVKGKLSCKVR